MNVIIIDLLLSFRITDEYVYICPTDVTKDMVMLDTKTIIQTDHSSNTQLIFNQLTALIKSVTLAGSDPDAISIKSIGIEYWFIVFGRMNRSC